MLAQAKVERLEFEAVLSPEHIEEINRKLALDEKVEKCAFYAAF
jgi:hypothetical protein